ncbi:MAG: WD40/YVTN/BNR-like repeat-containing protein [bacterium]
MMSIRLLACMIVVAGGVLMALMPSLSPAQSERPLIELLGSTHIHGLAVHRADPGRLLIATHHGLHALNVDAGTTAPVSEQQDDFMGFTAHPAEAGILYASGHPAGGGNLGFIASEDGGKSWTTLSAGVDGPVDFHQMDVSKADASVIYGVHGGLQASQDGGRTWQRVGPVPEGLIDIAASARDAEHLFAATQQGLLVSQDGGHNWQPDPSLRQPVSVVETTADGSVFAFMLGSGLLHAQDTSLEWQALSNGFGDRYLLHLAVDPHDPDCLFASTQHNEVMASRDGGRTWQVLAAP